MDSKILIFLGFLICASCCFSAVSANFVFRIQRDVPGGEQAHLQGRILGDSNIRMEPLSRNHDLKYRRLYAKVWIGTPSRLYNMRIEMASEFSWLYCADCEDCPEKNKFGIPLTPYDPSASMSSSLVNCADQFCTSIYNLTNCRPSLVCYYRIDYGKKYSIDGYFVKDRVTLERYSGIETLYDNLIFGCVARWHIQKTISKPKPKSKSDSDSGSGSDPDELDGVLGFGKGKSSIINQLAADGMVKKMFSHCINKEGAGILAIGEVVQPIVNTTQMVANRTHYSVIVTQLTVGSQSLNLTGNGTVSARPREGIIGSSQPLNLTGNASVSARPGEAIIDSGTALVYLPDYLYSQVILAVHTMVGDHDTMNRNPCIMLHENKPISAFPDITFYFGDKLTLTVPPRDYLSKSGLNWCVLWQNGGTETNPSAFILGEMALANKLVLYDLEKQVIGWTEQDCNLGVQVKDIPSGIADQVSPTTFG
ncbi:Xylanase inhibitor, N-terminal [Dillenia turbinata]|uniref:Xylanase inhibitor, N-terminal n=1 Tax=Dillenia turbinata TaxID=194707 RepID=A0AAN8UFD2_9MAGN